MKKTAKHFFILISFILIILLACIYIFLRESYPSFFGGDNQPDTPFSDPPTAVDLPMNNSVSISDIDLAKQTVSIDATVKDDCIFILRLVDEEVFFADELMQPKTFIDSSRYAEHRINTEEIGEDAQISYEFVNVSLEAEIIADLPDYFVAAGVLVDENGEEISDYSYYIKNTRRFEQFESITAEDFKDDPGLLIFDESEQTSFGVLADGVRYLTAKSISESVDVYKIDSPSEEINPGDIIYVTDGAETVLCKAFYVKESNGIVEVTYSSYNDRAELSDFYKFLKVDMYLTENESAEEDASGAMPLSSVNKDDYKEDYDKKYKLNFPAFSFDYGDPDENNSMSLKGQIYNGYLRVYGYYIWAPEILGNYFECKNSSETEFYFKVGIEGKGESEKKEYNYHVPKSIGMLRIPTPIAGLAVTIDVAPFLHWEMSGGLSFKNILVESYTSFFYSTSDGYKTLSSRNKCKLPSDEDWIKFESDLDVGLGLEIELGLKFFGEVLGVSIKGCAELCPKIVDKDNMPYNANRYPSVWHSCAECYACSINRQIKVDASVSIGINKKLKLTLFTVNLYDDCKYNIYSCYVSRPSSDTGLVFGRGVCQNYFSNITVNAKCGCDEIFECDLDYINGAGNRIVQNESNNKKHSHNNTKYAHITITNTDTGEVLYDFLYDEESPESLFDGKLYFSVKNFKITATFVCEYTECPKYTMSDDRDLTLDVEYLKHTVKHTVVYNGTQDLECYESGSFYGFSGDVEYPTLEWEEDGYLISFRNPVS